MQENDYWLNLLECNLFREEIGIPMAMGINEFKLKVNREPKFRLAVTLAVIQRFLSNKPCLRQASEGGLNAGRQLFF